MNYEDLFIKLMPNKMIIDDSGCPYITELELQLFFRLFFNLFVRVYKGDSLKDIDLKLLSVLYENSYYLDGISYDDLKREEL